MKNFQEIIEKFKIPIGLSLIGVVLIIGGFFASGLDQAKPQGFPKESLVDSKKLISVDVSGAVAKVGVYQLAEGSRIEEAIAAAGGFNDQANQEYISKHLNMAQRLMDGTKVYVPSVGETWSSSIQTGTNVAGAQTLTTVNINTATQAELEALPGIGPVAASKIISNRPYQRAEELLSKKVIGKATFEKIKDAISVY